MSVKISVNAGICRFITNAEPITIAWIINNLLTKQYL